MRYAALIDGEAGAYGVVFPDLPGCVAMGVTLDEAMINAADSLRDFVADAREHGEEVPSPRDLDAIGKDPEVRQALAEGSALTSVALVLPTGRPVKANLSIDEGVLRAIDAEASRRNLTRSGVVELMARHLLEET